MGPRIYISLNDVKQLYAIKSIYIHPFWCRWTEISTYIDIYFFLSFRNLLHAYLSCGLCHTSLCLIVFNHLKIICVYLPLITILKKIIIPRSLMLPRSFNPVQLPSSWKTIYYTDQLPCLIYIMWLKRYVSLFLWNFKR
jgi:hypothetical protein